jgi:hypothetical protein
LNLLRCRDGIRSRSPVKLVNSTYKAGLDPIWLGRTCELNFQIFLPCRLLYFTLI